MTSLVHEMQMQTCTIRIQSDSCNCLIWQNRALNPTNPMHLPQTTSPQHIPVAMMRCNGMFTQHVHCMQQGTVCACGKHAAAAVSHMCVVAHGQLGVMNLGCVLLTCAGCPSRPPTLPQAPRSLHGLLRRLRPTLVPASAAHQPVTASCVAHATRSA